MSNKKTKSTPAPEPEPASGGALIRAYRESEGLSQEQFASSIGATQSALWRWESDEQAPQPVMRHVLEIVASIPVALWWTAAELALIEKAKNRKRAPKVEA